MMNIYVDGMFFRLSGIGRLYENLMLALSESGSVSRIATIVPASRELEFRRSIPNRKVDARFVDYPPLGFGDIFRKGLLIRKLRPSPDVHFFPNFNVPFFLKRDVISTVNDLIPISSHFDLRADKKLAFRFLVGRAIRISDQTICISETAASELQEQFGISRKRIRVIYPWLDRSFGEEAINNMRHASPNVPGDYLLFVGNRFIHKNLRCLFQAFRELLPQFPGLRVVIAGARMRPRDDVDEAAEDPMLDGKVVQFPHASDAEIRNLYAHARVFVFPSFQEGFGIPPLEAIACGIPVVCSDIPVLREVCGNAVLYANPSDPGSFARAIKAILAGSPSEIPGPRERKQQLSRYREEISIGQYLDLLHLSPK